MNRKAGRFPVYARFVALYPEMYRRRYGEQLLQATADMLDDAPGRIERIKIWARVGIHLPMDIAKQQLLYTNEVMRTETPRYLTRSSLIASILLLPFFMALSANAIDKAINHQTLYNAWLWRKPFAGLWILYLPEIALLIAIASYSVYMVTAYRGEHLSLKKMLDFRRLWLVLMPAFLAVSILGILAFHDSYQCVEHSSPSYLLGHVHKVWECANSSKIFTQEFTQFL